MSTENNGEFLRWESGFRNWVTTDGSPGPSGEGGLPAVPKCVRHIAEAYTIA